WGWKPEKRALEYLFSAGELMIARRERFQRVYDLRERVLPGWNAARLPLASATHRALVANAVRALGVATARWAADYYRMGLAETSAAIKSLVRDGELLPARIESVDGDAFLLRDHLPTLAAIRRGRRSSHATLLSPFDPVVWDRKRALALFGFDYRIECYTPEAKRRYGYFTLPILAGDRLVGRLDAKAHRVDGLFEVKSLHLEDGIALDDALAEKIACAIHACAGWHGTPRVHLRRVVPREAAAVLRRAINSLNH
ncbi:MAG TPA: crosslink repair DNA glycosylase YcaQ family protein, partial [Thermoanaerobaculia bacterium]|nr:crosslink repair DNA glycosylase YcaQ family protein [Thermoanaerobaculia bacterium]